jgi:hypothetical protein
MFITGHAKAFYYVTMLQYSVKHCYEINEHIQHSVIILCHTVRVVYARNCCITGQMGKVMLCSDFTISFNHYGRWIA